LTGKRFPVRTDGGAAVLTEIAFAGDASVVARAHYVARSAEFLVVVESAASRAWSRRR
jgi:hypothetical protein